MGARARLVKGKKFQKLGGHGRHDHVTEQGTQEWNKKDPLQGIGGPMTIAWTKAMKQALTGLIQEVIEQEPIYLTQFSAQTASRGVFFIAGMLKTDPSPTNKTQTEELT